MNDNLVYSDFSVLGGIPCVINTRIPISLIFDYLSKGWSVDEILGNFPPLKREQVQRILTVACQEISSKANNVQSTKA